MTAPADSRAGVPAVASAAAHHVRGRAAPGLRRRLSDRPGEPTVSFHLNCRPTPFLPPSSRFVLCPLYRLFAPQSSFPCFPRPCLLPTGFPVFLLPPLAADQGADSSACARFSPCIPFLRKSPLFLLSPLQYWNFMVDSFKTDPQNVELWTADAGIGGNGRPEDG